MENTIAILTMAITAVSMFIGLGQLIIAFATLEKRKTSAKKNWALAHLDWVAIGGLFIFSIWGMIRFGISFGDPSREEIYAFGCYVFGISVAYSLFLTKSTLKRQAKRNNELSANVYRLSESVVHLETRLLDEHGDRLQ